MYETDPGSLGRQLAALDRRVRTVVIDEIQKVPSLLDEIQAIYDAAPRRWQFVLTGSSARRLRAGAANLLPGRSHVFTLHPVCGLEAQSAGHILPAPAAPLEAAPLFPALGLDRLLLFGSLPGVRTKPAARAGATLEAYVDLYLEEEVRREGLVRDLGPFAAFLRLAALESGGQVNLAKLSKESGIAASTLKTYYQVLVDSFVGHWMTAYGSRARKRLLTTPRFYLFDVGVRNAAADLEPGASLLKTQGGRLLEHWIAQDLMARASYLGRGHRVSFWRTASGAEVDFVWETPRVDTPIEVKWTDRPSPADARHLETFLDLHPGRAKRGLVVCRCSAAQQLTERVRAIPWSAL